MKSIKLTSPKSGNISQIIHISDIHIRLILEKRYEEYSIVFKRFIETISTLSSVRNNSAVTVITGDIFDKKNMLDTTSINLCAELLHPLADLMPVYLLTGNHDYRQDLHENSDMIGAISTIIRRSNVHHLNVTGHYEVGDVGFGVVIVSDTLLRGATFGQVDQLPPFPNPALFSDNVTIRCALFHGTIINSSLQNYTKSPTGIPIDWFNGYTLALLGDIHMQQWHHVINIKPSETNPLNIIERDKTSAEWDVNNEGPVWGYPGSLVQQNFGEPLYGHGFFIWDLDEGYIERQHVHSDYGFMDVKNIKNRWFGFLGAKSPPIDLEELFNTFTDFPTKLRLRIRGKTTPETMNDLRDIFSRYHRQIIYAKTCSNIELNIITGCMKEELDDEMGDNSYDENNPLDDDTDRTKEFDLSIYNTPEKWVRYIQTQNPQNMNVDWSKWIYTPETLLIDTQKLNSMDIYDKIVDRNKIIQKHVLQYKSDLDSSQFIAKQKMSLCYMKWAWILCYVDNNYLDFTKMIGKITVINGPNDAGKTSLLNTICVGLFGDEIPSRVNKQRSFNIISNSKPLKEKAFIEITFNVGNDQYLIRRDITLNRDGRAIYKARLSISGPLDIDTGAGAGWKMLYDGNTAVDNWIKINVGTLDDFLTSCMLTQKSDKEFFKLKPAEQLNVFDIALHLDSVSSFVTVLDESLKAHEYFKIYYKSQLAHVLTNSELEKLQIQVNDLEDQEKDINVELKSCSDFTYHDEFALDCYVIEQKYQNIVIRDDFTFIGAIDVETLKNEIYSETNMADELRRKYGFTEYEPDHESEFEGQIEEPTPSRDQVLYMVNEFLKLSADVNHYTLIDYYNMFANNVAVDNMSEEQLLKERSDIELNRPNKPIESKVNIDKYLDEYNKLLGHIALLPHPYNNVQELQTFVPPIKPDTSLNLDKVFNTSIQKIGQQNFTKYMAMTKEEIEGIFSVVKQQMNESQDQEIVLLKRLQLLKQEITLHENEMKKAQENLISTIQTKPNEPSESLQSINEYKQRIYEHESLYQTKKTEHEQSNRIITDLIVTQKLNTQLHNELQLLSTHISEIESKQYPFNEKCDACKQQGWRLNLIDMYTRKTAVEKQLGALKYDENILVNELSERQKLEEWLEKFQIMIQRKSYYEQQEKLHDMLVLYGTCYQNSKALYDVKSQEKIAKQGELDRANVIYKQHQEKQKVMKQEYEIMDHVASHKDQWDFIGGEKIKRQRYNDMLNVTMAAESLQKISQQYTYYINQRAVSDKWDEWSMKKTINEEKYHTVLSSKYKSMLHKWIVYEKKQRQENYRAYKKLVNSIMDKKTKIERFNDFNQRLMDKQKWGLILDNKRKYDKYKQLCEEVKMIQKTLYEKKIRYEIENETHKKNEKTEQIYEYLNNMSEGLLQMKTLMSNFKKWLYENVVIPKLLEYTNDIVMFATHTDEFKLRSIVNTSSKGNLEFEWYLNNNNDITAMRPIESIGGFRQDIFNLALRIAITKLGASAIKCQQLFMDEAFVWADVSNLEKIPDFLRSILNIYQSVILVTHLETLKTCGDIEININFKTRTTRQIQFN